MSLNTILATAPLTATGYHLKATGTALGQSLIWDNGTNVGIGNQGTTYTLDVSGTGRFTGALNGTSASFSISAGSTLQAFQTSATNGLTALIRQTGAGGNGNNDIGLVVDIQGAGDNDRIVNFRYFDGTNYNSRFVVQRGGNIGIGTTTPSGLLQVGVANSGIYFDTSTQYTPKIIAAGTISDIQIQSVGNGGNVYLNAPGATSLINFQVNGSERMRITSGGVIQIAGLTSNGTVSTQSSNGSLYVSSDANLKIEDGYIENGLEKVLALKPRYFYWKDKEAFSADRQLGFYAQEVNAVSEETANTPPEGCGWGIYDRGLVALLTSAIQEMNTKFEEQNQTIQNLQEQINILAK